MEKKSAITLIVVVGVLALLVGCVGGALAGGLASYFIASRTECTNLQPEPAAPREFQMPAVPITPGVPPFDLEGVSALVTIVTPDSPADRAGLKAGDIIVQFDGQVLPEAGPVELMTAYRPGDRVTITVLRGGKEVDIDVALGENPENPGRAWLGITYQAMPGGMPRFNAPGND